MGGDDAVGGGEQGIGGGDGFLRHHIHGGTPELAAFQSLCHSIFVDDRTPSGVQQNGAVLHLGNCFGIDQVFRFGEQGAMEADNVTVR